MKKILAIFPGQGSQKVGMGKELHDSSELAKRIFATADEVLGFPLSQVCFEGPIEKLTLTEIAQPAILTVATICFELLKEQVGSSLNVVSASGHSLGEYSALVASGALRFEDAVSLVNKRGKYMQEAVASGAGKMAAVLGKEVSDLEKTLSSITDEVVGIANVNAPGQVVIAGSKAGVEKALTLLSDTKTIELQVSAPFHCSLMKPAEDRLAVDLEKTLFSPAKVPVFCNYSALGITDAQQIREALRLQVCGRVRWVECMENAITQTSPDMAVEFGAGNVLTGLLKRINPKFPRTNVGTLPEAEKLAAELRA